MKDLTTNLNDKIVKALQNKVSTYEAKISKLKDIIEKKNEEIENLAKYRDDLNSELEDTKGKTSELENKLDKLNSEVYDLKKTVTLKDDELNKLNAEVDDLKKIDNSKDDESNKLNAEINDLKQQIEKLNENLKEKEKRIEDQRAKLEKAETELSSLKPTEPTKYISEARLVCPKCGARGRDLKVEEDKSKVLGYIGHTPMYSKTNVCKKCGEKF
ncbi:MAG: hypothetical protein ACFE75_03985 [Candidatus Hodarchaeota archaeon]